MHTYSTSPSVKRQCTTTSHRIGHHLPPRYHKLLSLVEHAVPGGGSEAVCTIRQATPSDAQAIARDVDPSWSLTQISQEISRDVSLVKVAVLPSDETKIVGWISCWLVPPFEMQIIQITVAHPMRRRGIAHALMMEVVQESMLQGIESVILEAREDNVAAISLYEKLGFTTVGKRKNYYRDGTAAILMSMQSS
jgi:ribosomal-protein-alanine N-acetyltransferase